MTEFFMLGKLTGRGVRMAKSTDKRLRVAYTMPRGLRKRQPGKEYDVEQDEVLAWVSSQPELVNVLVSKLGDWGYIRYDPETGTWGGAGNDD